MCPYWKHVSDDKWVIISFYISSISCSLWLRIVWGDKYCMRNIFIYLFIPKAPFQMSENLLDVNERKVISYCFTQLEGHDTTQQLYYESLFLCISLHCSLQHKQASTCTHTHTHPHTHIHTHIKWTFGFHLPSKSFLPDLLLNIPRQWPCQKQ